MRRTIEHVEIQEPPIQEIHKKRSCLRRSCLTGCTGIIVFIIASVLFLRFFVISQPKELSTIPEQFPANIPLYDKDAITHITIISGKQKSRAVELTAVLPKMILSPVLSLLDAEQLPSERVDQQGNVIRAKRTGWQEFVKRVRSPEADRRDVVLVEWTKLDAEPRFLEQYFRSGFQKAKFEITTSTYTTTTRQFGFSQNSIDGALYIEDRDSQPGTDYLALTVSLPLAITPKEKQIKK